MSTDGNTKSRVFTTHDHSCPLENKKLLLFVSDRARAANDSLIDQYRATVLNAYGIGNLSRVLVT